jgi:hypothetical protein
MRGYVLVGAAAILGLALAAGPAAAQPPTPYARPGYGPGYRPSLSPYLNLARQNGIVGPAVDYYLGTIPEFQRRANAQFFGAQIQALEARPPVVNLAPEDQDLFRPLKESGHPTAFGNTLSYFNNNNPRLNIPRPAAPVQVPPGRRP